MNIGPIVKAVVRIVASAGAGQVVSNIIKANVPANLTQIEKIVSFVGEIVVSGVIADLSADYVEKQIEEFKKKDEPEKEEKPEN